MPKQHHKSKKRAAPFLTRILGQLKSGAKPGIDKSLLITILILASFGALAVFNSSVVSAFREFGDQYHFVKDHLVYLGIGSGLMLVFSQIDYPTMKV